MGLKNKLLLLFCGLNQFVSRRVGLDADENANLLGLRERGIKFVKAADEEVADETIEESRVITKQDPKTISQSFARLVSDECQVSRCFHEVCLRLDVGLAIVKQFNRRLAIWTANVHGVAIISDHNV